MTPEALTAALKSEAFRLGFDLAGAARAVEAPDFERFRLWLAEGFAGKMDYLSARLDAYRHPSAVLDGARSVLMLGMNYRTVEPAEVARDGHRPNFHAGAGAMLSAADQGAISFAGIARFAWGEDYHKLIRGRLRRLAALHRRLVPAGRARGIVDTAPFFEKRFGQLAGLGWIGKNTLLINPRFGSWFFLAALLSTEELEYDEPFGENHCGDCRACLDACPTGALIAPGVLDARKCLSYLTIERRGDVSAEESRICGEQKYGCDACQEPCPWNRATPATAERAFYPDSSSRIFTP